MTVVALTAFITITKKDHVIGDSNNNNTVVDKFQNGKYGEIVDGHKYLSFIYQGAAMNRSGDNLEASIVLANNKLSMAYVKDFVDSKYYIEVETFFMTNNFDKDTATRNGGLITHEYWLAAGLRYDPEAIEMILTSPIDAVTANTPQKTLSKDQCLHLPVTGTIQNR